jgi:hypothetical protein
MKTVQGSILGPFYFDCSDGFEGVPQIFFIPYGGKLNV